MTEITSITDGTRPSGDPLLAETTSVPAKVLLIKIDTDNWAQVRAEVRQRPADGASTPMTAAHLDALGLRDAITDLMLEG